MFPVTNYCTLQPTVADYVQI